MAKTKKKAKAGSKRSGRAATRKQKTTLRAMEVSGGGYVVADSDTGLIWKPSEQAIADIAAAKDPAARCLEICKKDPSAGGWT